MPTITTARLHGTFNLVNGLWPLVHLDSFESVFGPKTDRWLVRTVAGLLITNGIAQLTVPGTPAGIAHARRLGIGTAATLAAIDLIYAPAGRISKIYFLDALVELAWIRRWQK